MIVFSAPSGKAISSDGWPETTVVPSTVHVAASWVVLILIVVDDTLEATVIVYAVVFVLNSGDMGPPEALSDSSRALVDGVGVPATLCVVVGPPSCVVTLAWGTSVRACVGTWPET